MTVWGETKSPVAISRLVFPSAASSTTLSSASVRASHPAPGRSGDASRRLTPSFLRRPRTLLASQADNPALHHAAGPSLGDKTRLGERGRVLMRPECLGTEWPPDLACMSC